MSRSVKEPLLSVALPQQEGTRSFAVESEEAVALPSEPSAIPLSPLHDPQSYAAAKQQGGGSSSSSGMLSSASAGQSATQPVSSTKQQHQQQQSSSSYRERRPERQRDGGSGGGAAANHTTASASRHAAAAASAGGGPAVAGGRRASTRVLTSCSADTPAAQRAAEEEASRDVDFNPVILCPLQNLGNTCYFNSGVQLLANCPALVYGLRNSPLAPSWSSSSSSPAGRATTRLCARGGVATHALFTDFAALLSRMENNNLSKGESLSPVRALDALATVHSQFEGRSQQDAAEMMTAVLASLAEEGGQYAEVTELLKSFTNDASATASTAAAAFPAPAAAAAAASSTPSGHSRSAEPYMVDDYSQPSPPHSQNGAPSSSLPSPNKNDMNSSAGARSAHELAMLRFMQQVNSENEELERRVKQRQGKPYTGTFRAPRLHFNPVMDGFRGYSVSQVECHHCHCVSRTVSEYNALLLDVPTSRERSHFAARHPRLRRLAPDGAPLQAKKQAGFTWWNPLSFFTSFWDTVTRLFSSSVSFPLTLQECLDIHFEPVKLQGSNKYRCDSCGTTSEATKSESLLGLPEYLVLHMKRFEAGRCFNGKKTDPVIFPASWKPLTPAAAARAKLSGAPPEILDLRRYLHPVAAPYAEPIPRCLRGCLGGAVLEGEEEEEEADVAGSRSNRRRQGGDQIPSSPSSPHPQTANALAAARSPAGRQGADAPALTPSADGTTPWAMPTTYTLDGIVNHHGGYEGGHYTVYLYKATAEQQTWVYVSDDEIEKASAGEVADSEEYVLLYRRQPIVQPPPESNEGELLRQKACYYLSLRAGGPGSPSAAAGAAAAAMVESSDAAVPSSSSASVTSTSSSPTYQPYVYISRMWLQRVAFLHEPGPIVNRLCYCRPEEQNKLTMYTTLFPRDVAVPAEVPHVHGPPVDWFYVPVTQTDYNIFYDAFGGNAAVTAAEVDAIRGMQEKFAEAIAAAERAKTGSKPSMRQMNRR